MCDDPMFEKWYMVRPAELVKNQSLKRLKSSMRLKSKFHKGKLKSKLMYFSNTNIFKEDVQNERHHGKTGRNESIFGSRH